MNCLGSVEFSWTISGTHTITQFCNPRRDGTCRLCCAGRRVVNGGTAGKQPLGGGSCGKTDSGVNRLNARPPIQQSKALPHLSEARIKGEIAGRPSWTASLFTEKSLSPITPLTVKQASMAGCWVPKRSAEPSKVVFCFATSRKRGSLA